MLKNTLFKMQLVLTAAVFCFAVRASDSPYGTASHLFGWEYEVADQELPMMPKEGIKMLRGPAGWAMLAGASGKAWNFKMFDHILEMGEKAGVKYLPLLHMPPRKFRPPLKHLDAWLEYARIMAERYSKRVLGFEVWNEPNLQGISAEDYTKLLKATAAEIRKVDPSVKIVYSGLSGIPFPYIEKSFQNGAAEVMDVMSVHPYPWQDVPETRLAEQLQRLRALMKKYGAEHKPLWLTEVGYSSEPQSDFQRIVLPKLLQEMGLQVNKTTAITFYDPEYRYYTETHSFELPKVLPTLKKVRTIRFSMLKNLPVKPDEVLILPNVQAYPYKYGADLVDFVRRGGKVLSPAGIPFYIDLQKLPNGEIRGIQVDSKFFKQLHMNFEASWTHKGVPAKCSSYKWANPAETAPVPQWLTTHFFFNAEFKKGNDKWVPILYGVEGKYNGVMAGVLHLDSDLKGKVAVSGLNWRGGSEDFQAKLLPRLYILAFANGVQKIFWHNYRSTEVAVAGVEAYFGLHSRSLFRKPVSHAGEVLSKMYPDSSCKITIHRTQDIYLASWQNPDGRKVSAIWRGTIREAQQNVEIIGKNLKFTDYLGKNVVVDVKNNLARMNVGPGVIYIEGAEKVALK